MLTVHFMKRTNLKKNSMIIRKKLLHPLQVHQLSIKKLELGENMIGGLYVLFFQYHNEPSECLFKITFMAVLNYVNFVNVLCGLIENITQNRL